MTLVPQFKQDLEHPFAMLESAGQRVPGECRNGVNFVALGKDAEADESAERHGRQLDAFIESASTPKAPVAVWHEPLQTSLEGGHLASQAPVPPYHVVRLQIWEWARLDRAQDLTCLVIVDAVVQFPQGLGGLDS